MWSRFDAATRTYSLVKSVGGGAPAPVGVAPRTGGPFDIDLGTNRAGSTFGVYTREDGDIYRLNVATGRETKLDRLSTPSQVEYSPTIQRGEIAFIRDGRGLDELRIGNTTSASKGSRLIVKHRSLVSAELGTSHVAYVRSVPWSFEQLLVHVRNIRTHADHMIYRAKSGGANAADVTRPTVVTSPAGFLWARTNDGSETGNRLVRYTLRGSKFDYAQGSPDFGSTAWAGATFGAATASVIDDAETQGGCTDNPLDPTANYRCTVALTGPLEFDLRP